MGNLAKHIDNFVKRLDIPGLTYETMYAYLTNTAQYAENLLPKGYTPPKELTVAIDSESNKALGFAHWLVSGMPHISTTYLDYIYIWEGRKGDVASALFGRWRAFARLHKCEIFFASCIDDKVLRYADIECKKTGYEFIKTKHAIFYAIKKEIK